MSGEGNRLNRVRIVGIAAVILGVLVAQIALAGGSGGSAKKLKKQVAALQQQVDTLARQPGPKGDKGDTGTTGTTGATGSALAYAYVIGNGSVDSANSKNISSANVSSPSTGVYCFDLPFTVHNAVVTPDNGGGAGTEDRTAQVSVDVGTHCTTGPEVEIWDPITPGLASHSFYIVLN